MLVPVAQWIARWTSTTTHHGIGIRWGRDPEAVGSSPTGDSNLLIQTCGIEVRIKDR